MMPAHIPTTKTTLIRVILTLLGVFGYASFGYCQSYTIMPAPFGMVQSNSGFIVNGGCVWTYTAGTLNAAATYSDTIGTQNTNPIKADSAGRFTAYLVTGQSYKFVYENTPCTVSPPVHGPVLRTADNIAATPSTAASVDFTCTAGEAISAGLAVYLSDGSGAKTPGQCYKADAANTYSSTTPIVGMTPSAIASGAAGTVRLSGSVTGLSSLTVGTSAYYVGTAGAITTTAPSNVRFVGYADTATSLLVVANPNATPPNSDNAIEDFRLTLTTGVPVTTADVTAATTIFATPKTGNRIALFNSAGVATVYTSTEFSIPVPATTSQMYDIYAFANGSTPTLELLAWTNDTTRATAIVLTTTGVPTKSGDLTRRYLASFRTTTVSGQTEDSLTKRYLWNYYNRVPRPLLKQSVTASWNYTLATIRQADFGTVGATNQVEVVVGVAEVPVDLVLTAAAVNGSTDGSKFLCQIGFGEDSTTTFVAGQVGGAMASAQAGGAVAVLSPGMARLLKYPAVGRHIYSWNEWSQANGTTTWYGVPAGASGPSGTANGISGSIQG